MGNLLNDVVINKLSGGLGRRTPDKDMVSGLLFTSSVGASAEAEVAPVTRGKKGSKATLATKVVFEPNVPRRLASIEDAEAIGIYASSDAGGVSVYYQISQFFRINPSGDLWVMGVPAADYAALVNRSNDLLIAAEGEIRQLAISHSDLAATSADTDLAVSAAATITREAFEKYHRPLEIFIEGKGFGNLVPDVSAATNLDTLNAPNVSVVIAMDKQKATEDNYKNTAAVGVLLGAVSRAKVSENIAWIEKFNLTGEGFRSIGFVGGNDLKTEGDQNTLNEKRYIFARKHIGIPGIYFNDSHTCIEVENDFAYIEANRTINKAARIARTALLPKLNSPVLVDPDSGKLPPSVVKGYETLCRSALERMISNEEASDIDVFVDPNQDILADSQLKIKIAVVPLGTARKIVVDLGFKNPFQITAAAAS